MCTGKKMLLRTLGRMGGDRLEWPRCVDARHRSTCRRLGYAEPTVLISLAFGLPVASDSTLSNGAFVAISKHARYLVDHRTIYMDHRSLYQGEI